jgi:hypothetical protein
MTNRDRPHPDAGNLLRNHYAWFMPDPPTDAGFLADTKDKMTEALTDPFAHDMAQVVLRLLATIDRLATNRDHVHSWGFEAPNSMVERCLRCGDLRGPLAARLEERIEAWRAIAIGYEAEIERLTRERDLAVAHDRQPYPTAWAYEQACRVRDRFRAALSECIQPCHECDAADIARAALGPRNRVLGFVNSDPNRPVDHEPAALTATEHGA